ncbi:hypothetical protein Tco_1379664, partial [Tanacetum coccineum]
TPIASAAKISQFTSGDNISFNIEVTQTTEKGIQHSGGDSGSSGNGKRTIIDLDEYNKDGEVAKSGKEDC